MALAICLSSCRSEPALPPLTPPAIDFQTEHYTGSPLAGSTSLLDGAVEEADGGNRLRAEDSLFVDCRVLFLEFMPKTALDPIATRTRLIAASRGEAPVLSSIILASGARVGVREPAESFISRVDRGQMGRFLEIADPAVAIPAGTTALIEATAQEWVDVPDSGRVQKKVSLHISNARASGAGKQGGDSSVLLAVEDLAAPVARDELSELNGDVEQQAVLRRELICLEDALPRDGSPLVIVFRSRFGDGQGAIVAVLRALSPSEEQSEHLLALSMDDLQLEGAVREDAPWNAAEVRTLASAFQALDVARFHRAGLVFLSTRTGAKLAEDLALSAEEETLAAFVRGISADKSALDPNETVESGWLFERRAFLFLATLQIEDPPLVPQLVGLLVRHAGEVGRYPGLIRELVGRSSDIEYFRELLIEENRIFLEDSNPSARVRALDWLTVLNLAPDGFDPLAGTTERRKALAVAREKRDAMTIAVEAGGSR